MKTCSRCRDSKDGLNSACKVCLKKYDDSRLADPKRKKARLEYQKTEKGRESHNSATKRWVEKNAIKRGVHIITGNAIRDGRLHKRPCSVCGDKKVNAHHDDYAKPLDVRWLCDNHHKLWHRINGEGLNAR